MKRKPLLTIALLTLGAVAHAKKPPVPRFHCAGKTQLEMNRCAAEELRAGDAELARALRAALARLGDDEERAKLQVAEELWTQFRRAECEARNWPNHEGSIYPVLRDLCLTGMARDRSAALAELPLQRP